MLPDAAAVSPLLSASALLPLVLVECRLQLEIAHWPCVSLVHDWLQQQLLLARMALTCCCAVFADEPSARGSFGGAAAIDWQLTMPQL